MNLCRIAFLLVVLAGSAANDLSAAKRPNVILIYTDDQGTIDANCYGAKDLITPTIDGLAATGVRFTQFYAAAPVCSPSRAAVLTGRVPQRAGVPGNVSSAPGNHGMPTEQMTIAEMMKADGYRTGHVGKWHLGYTPETMPNGQGFDSSFGHMGGCIDNFSHFFYWNGPNRHDLWENGHEVWRDGQYFPALMVEQGRRFIEANKDEPFFLYFAINLPHYPLQGTDKWREKYKNLPAPRRMYAAFVSSMDEAIGELLGKLDELKLREDTIVIFQSDHGHSTEDRTFGGGGSAGPYRGAKFSLFEGGIRVPAIISWPGRLPEGEVRDKLCVACDWLPTIADLCGVELPKRKLDGVSIVPVIKSAEAKTPHETFHWQTGRDSWAVRSGDWKLLGNPRDTSNKAPLGPNDKLFLVNLAKDHTEMKNLASDNPDVVMRLQKQHDEWVREVSPK
ncbi:MAG: sulfatase-like hydrolase/transferase [Planctomycetota bacterium]|nr:sulfatase-like hydrolase/transferase [Planctomycetota bacterium]MDA1251314.1 sulfatase-like hydrolase/transferase [Planctomycetota bacterium]